MSVSLLCSTSLRSHPTVPFVVPLRPSDVPDRWSRIRSLSLSLSPLITDLDGLQYSFSILIFCFLPNLVKLFVFPRLISSPSPFFLHPIFSFLPFSPLLSIISKPIISLLPPNVISTGCRYGGVDRVSDSSSSLTMFTDPDAPHLCPPAAALPPGYITPALSIPCPNPYPVLSPLMSSLVLPSLPCPALSCPVLSYPILLLFCLALL